MKQIKRRRQGTGAALLGVLCFTLSVQGAASAQDAFDDVTVYGEFRSAAKVPTNGLVLWCSFNTNGGGTVEDRSGTGNTGTVSGASFTTNGVISGAYVFDNANDYVDAGSGSTLDFGANDFSICCWAKVDDGSSGLDIIYGRGGYGTNGNGLLVYKGLGVMYFKTMEGGTQSIVSVADTDTGWAHWAFTRSATIMTIYKNAEVVECGTNTLRDLTRSVNAYFGRTQDAAASYDFGGTLDEVQLYARALSGQEVADIYSCTTNNVLMPSFSVHGNSVFNNGIDYLEPLGDVPMGRFTVQP